jgi:hypothetical protein
MVLPKIRLKLVFQKGPVAQVELRNQFFIIAYNLETVGPRHSHIDEDPVCRASKVIVLYPVDIRWEAPDQVVEHNPRGRVMAHIHIRLLVALDVVKV